MPLFSCSPSEEVASGPGERPAAFLGLDSQPVLQLPDGSQRWRHNDRQGRAHRGGGDFVPGLERARAELEVQQVGPEPVRILVLAKEDRVEPLTEGCKRPKRLLVEEWEDHKQDFIGKRCEAFANPRAQVLKKPFRGSTGEIPFKLCENLEPGCSRRGRRRN